MPDNAVQVGVWPGGRSLYMVKDDHTSPVYTYYVEGSEEAYFVQSGVVNLTHVNILVEE